MTRQLTRQSRRHHRRRPRHRARPRHRIRRRAPKSSAPRAHNRKLTIPSARFASAGGDAIAVRCDVTDAAAVERLYAETRARFGPVDIVVANAGGNFSRASVEESDIADWELTVRVNLLGVYYSCKFAIPDLKGRAGISSWSAPASAHRVVDDAHSAYGASKAGAWMFVRALAAELRPYNICVNELIPGLVQTEITADVNRSDESAFGAEWFKAAGRRPAAGALPGDPAPDRSHRPELQPHAPRFAVGLALQYVGVRGDAPPLRSVGEGPGGGVGGDPVSTRPTATYGGRSDVGTGHPSIINGC